MARKTFVLTSLLLGVFLAVGFAQSAGSAQGGAFKSRLQSGIELYAGGQWGEAIIELRRFQQDVANVASRAEAQFWIAMAQISAGQYEDAIHDFEEITRIDPRSVRVLEVPYQKARALYYLAKYNEAIVLFKQYADSIHPDGRYVNGIRVDNWNMDGRANNPDDEYNRKSAAIYWIAECLFSLEEYDKAEEMFTVVVNQYTKSRKYESASNRLVLIKQKKLEAQLLDLMRQNGAPPPSGAVSKASGYEDALSAYQKSIAPYLAQDTSKENYTPGPAVPAATGRMPLAQTDPNTTMRLLAVKTQALEMMERLMTTLNAFENIETGRW
ncbi:MAG: tetratricopeptide repeat protein [Spirochaetaceae bacterium]|jgi:TolA-binding protein|nr:tetratricopeptide repeat protein [Spirochaetaceae bacterium]